MRLGAQTIAKFSDVIRLVALCAATLLRNPNRNLKRAGG